MKFKMENTLCKMSNAALLALSALVLTACGGSQEKSPGESSTRAVESEMVGRVAQVTLSPTEGHAAAGTLTFVVDDDRVQVTGRIENLQPGKHGFHVHEKGDCSASDGSSAGGHYNPEGVPHAGPDTGRRHVGDLGNIEANSNGVATIQFRDDKIKLDGPHSIVGRSIIVHAGADDLSSQPSGAAGARVACGVVELLKSDS